MNNSPSHIFASSPNRLTNAPLVIAGPCSAESREQVVQTAQALHSWGVNTFRAGLWKPRTMPGSFEGVGNKGLVWLDEVRQLTGMRIATEVANAHHVETVLKAGIDMVWIGARTTSNPFAVQDIADALRGTNLPVMVKNPISPDIDLWIGAIERLRHVGITDIAAIHRGFSSIQKTQYRNRPMWQIPIELMRRLPQIPLFADPSHIGGRRDAIATLCQQALDLNFSGIMVESHIEPDEALSDSLQQITPEALHLIVEQLVVRDSSNATEQLAFFRHQIDDLDEELLLILKKRMEICREIGGYKQKNNLSVLQTDRYTDILNARNAQASHLRISPECIQSIFEAIHAESVRQQLKMDDSCPDSSHH